MVAPLHWHQTCMSDTQGQVKMGLRTKSSQNMESNLTEQAVLHLAFVQMHSQTQERCVTNLLPIPSK